MRVGGVVPGNFILYGTSSSQNEYTAMVKLDVSCMRDCCGFAGMAGGRTAVWAAGGGGGGKYRLFANL